MAERKPNLIERFLWGPQGRGAEEKGLFPFDQSMARGSWPITGPNGQSVFYNGTVDYAVATEDVIDNSAVMACLWWICTTFPEARLRVMKRSRSGRDTEVYNHALTRLWNRPNPYYSGRLMVQPGLISYNWRGEAFYRLVRNGQEQIIRMYYEPHWTCRPVRNNSEDFISHYQLYRDNRWVDVPLEDILHIRAGIDPENNMHGLSRLASALREVYTDNEAARYASAVMRKLGVLGGVVTPSDPDDVIGDPVALKAMLNAISTGDERGSWGVFSKPLNIFQPNNDPSKMDTRANRKITEERISALLGVPAIVAGLGAGLDRSTFANMSEAREMAYESNIIPTQAIWADELNVQLLDQMGDPETEYVDWDYSNVRVLQADENAKAQRWVTLYQGGLVKLSEARADLNLPTGPEEDVYKTEPAPLMPDVPQDAPQATEGGDNEEAAVSSDGKARTNGHAPTVPIWERESKSRKGERERAKIEEQMRRDVQGIIEDAYREVAG